MSDMLEKFKKAVPVLEKIEQAGFEAYFVGGSVRDALLHRSIEDVDIATSAFPEEIKQIFPKTIDVGIKHGTVVVIYNGENYEITTFRTDGEYTDYRRPDKVTFIRSLQEDLKRRDFTMNAIAMTKTGELIDPFSGQEDIKNKLIRTVGNAEERFTEDALRIMRAIRFVSQLNFRIEQDTYKAIEKYGELLTNISVERIYAEFQKILVGKSRKQAIRLLVEQNLHHYLPKLSGYGQELKQTADIIHLPIWTETEIWAILLILIDKEPVDGFLRAWKTPLRIIKAVKKIYVAYQLRKEQSWTKEMVYYNGYDTCISTEKIYSVLHHLPIQQNVQMVKNIWADLPINSREQLAISGYDLMNWANQKSGPWIKETLEKIEKAIINKEIDNDKSKIKEWLFP